MVAHRDNIFMLNSRIEYELLHRLAQEVLRKHFCCPRSSTATLEKARSCLMRKLFSNVTRRLREERIKEGDGAYDDKKKIEEVLWRSVSVAKES